MDCMELKHPGIVELAKLVTVLDSGSADSLLRQRAVALALELYRSDAISRSKCLEVARAAGSTTAGLDEAVRAVAEEWGDAPAPLLPE